MIEGKAHSEWQTQSGRSNTNHSGDQIYFSTKTALVGGEGKIVFSLLLRNNIYILTYKYAIKYEHTSF